MSIPASCTRWDGNGSLNRPQRVFFSAALLDANANYAWPWMSHAEALGIAMSWVYDVDLIATAESTPSPGTFTVGSRYYVSPLSSPSLG